MIITKGLAKKNREYQNDYNKRPGQKEKNRDRQRNKAANKKQKLTDEKEKNTNIFNEYSKGQNGNLCFDSMKNASADASINTGQTVCIFSKNYSLK